VSFVATLDNRTHCDGGVDAGLDVMHLLMPDGQGGEAVLLVVKSAFDIAPDGTPRPSQTPAKICMADVSAGGPGSDPIADSDLVLYKPRVDVLIHGAVAYAPKGRPITSLFVELHIGFPGGPASDVAAHDRKQAQLIKSLRVTGDRVASRMTNLVETQNPQDCWAGLVHEDVEVSLQNSNVGRREIELADTSPPRDN
jgi:hypothetical protein